MQTDPFRTTTFDDVFPSKAAAAIMQRARIVLGDDNSIDPVAVTGETSSGRTVRVLLSPRAMNRVRNVLAVLLEQELFLQCEREEAQGVRVTVVTPDKPTSMSRFVKELASEFEKPLGL